jgi:hypothetical protein
MKSGTWTIFPPIKSLLKDCDYLRQLRDFVVANVTVD